MAAQLTGDKILGFFSGIYQGFRAIVNDFSLLLINRLFFSRRLTLLRSEDMPFEELLPQLVGYTWDGKHNHKNAAFSAIIYNAPADLKFDSQVQYLLVIGRNTVPFQLHKLGVLDLEAKDAVIVNLSPMDSSAPSRHQEQIAAIILDLEANGVPRDHIVLIGDTVEAAMCLAAAAKFPGVKVIATRTFDRLDETVATKAQQMVPTSYLQNTIGLLMFYAARGLVRQSGLNINAANGLRQLPKDAVTVLGVDADPDIPADHNLSNAKVQVFKTLPQGAKLMLQALKRFKAQMTLKDSSEDSTPEHSPSLESSGLGYKKRPVLQH